MGQIFFTGNEAYKNILNVLKNLKIKKILLVCGNSFNKQEIANDVN